FIRVLVLLVHRYRCRPIRLLIFRRSLKHRNPHSFPTRRSSDLRAEDLKAAFRDDSIKGVICAIGGDDTYRLLPYLLEDQEFTELDRKSTRLNSSHVSISYAVFCLKKKNTTNKKLTTVSSSVTRP